MTQRKEQVWALVAQGKTNKEIATALSIAEKTVKAHMTDLFKSTGCSNRTQLALAHGQPAPDVQIVVPS